MVGVAVIPTAARSTPVDAGFVGVCGGVVVVANHISKIDPLTFGYFIDQAGRVPHFLAKAELFEHRWLGRVFVGTDMIPVRRGEAGAAASVAAAVAERFGDGPFEVSLQALVIEASG